jgi:hypothetical protein
LLTPVVAIVATAALILFVESFTGSDGLEGFAAVPALAVYLSFPFGAMILGTRNLRVGYRAADKQERDRLLWLVNGVLVSAWMILVPFAVLPLAVQQPWIGSLVPVAWCLAPAVLVFSIAVGVFYTGSVDPGLVLKRSTLLGIVGAAWIAVYAALETVTSGWIRATLGLPEVVASVALALVSAAIAAPLRKLAPMRGGTASNADAARAKGSEVH